MCKIICWVKTTVAHKHRIRVKAVSAREVSLQKQDSQDSQDSQEQE